jgi:hypothetical protein
MNVTLQNQSFGKPARRLICAALAAAITALTTQTVIHSAGQHEYGITATSLPATAPTATLRSAADTGADTARPITVARAH